MTPTMMFNKASAAPNQAAWPGAFWTMLLAGRDGADAAALLCNSEIEVESSSAAGLNPCTSPMITRS